MTRAARAARITGPARWFASGRLAWGCLLIVAAAPTYRAASGRDATALQEGVVEVLGLREVAQAALTGANPTGTVLRVGAAVDAIHCLSMVALAVGSAAQRRPALVGVATAAVAGGTGLVIAARS